MHATIQFVVCSLSGTALVLAVCVLAAPLLAMVVALGCVGAAWACLELSRFEIWNGLWERRVRSPRIDQSPGSGSG